jgi:hypothetical protein
LVGGVRRLESIGFRAAVDVHKGIHQLAETMQR